MNKDEIAVGGAASASVEEDVFALIPLPGGGGNTRVDTGNLVMSRQAGMVDGQFRLDTGTAARKVTCFVDAREGDVTEPIAVRIRYVGQGGAVSAASAATSVGANAGELEVPIVVGAVDGVLDPDRIGVKVTIPNYQGKVENDVVTLHWRASIAPFEDYFTVFGPLVGIPFDFNIDTQRFVKPNEGTTVDVSYSVSLAGVDKGSSVVTSVAIGEVSTEPGEVLPPDIEGVSNGVLNLATVLPGGAPATVAPYEGMKNGDIVFIEITDMDDVVLWDTSKRIPQESPVNQPVPFAIPRATLYELSGRTIKVFTLVFNGPGDPLRSTALPIRVLAPLTDLPPVEVPAAQGNSLDPEAVTGEFVKVVVKPYPGAAEGDTIRFRWVNASGNPAPFEGTDTVPANPQQDYEFDVPRAHVDLNIDKTATLSYTVTRGSDTPKPSDSFTLYIGEAFEAEASLDATGKQYIVAEKLPTVVPEFGTYLREARFGTAPYRYTSSDESVASVDNAGLVVARGKNGTVTITATDSANATRSYPITVKGVVQLFFVSASASFAGAKDACETAGARVPTVEEMKAFWRCYYPSTGPVATYMDWLSYLFWTATIIGGGTANAYDLNGSSEQGNVTGKDEKDFLQVVGVYP